jgi:HK97 family phage major capsid protein
MSSLAELATTQEVKGGSRAYVMLACTRFLAGHSDVAAAFRRRYPRSIYADRVERALQTRAATPGGTTAPTNWAGAITGDPALFTGEFAAALRPASVLGKLAYQPAPLHARLPLLATGAPPARWVAQGQSIPLTRASAGTVTLERYKLATITTTTKELVEATTDLDAVALLEADLQASIIEGRDVALLDPTLDAVPLERPASATFGAFTIPSSGNTVAAITADASAIVEHLIAAGSNLSRASLVCSQAAGLLLGGLRDANGAPAFPGAGPLGGVLLGLPLITSRSCGPQLVVIDASQLAVADAGVAVELSQEGSLEMTDAPVGAIDPPTAGQVLVPLWQTNSVAARCINFLSWAMLRPGCVALVSNFPEATA